jgi:hypothetical protein
VIWDIENVRIPKEAKACDIMAALWRVHVRDPSPSRRCSGAYAACSDRSLAAMDKNQVRHLLNNGCLNVRMMLSTGWTTKANCTDNLLIETMQDFALNCVLCGRRGTVVLITGDADFVRPALWCASQGCRLEVMFYGPGAAASIKRMQADSKTDWNTFLRQEVVLPHCNPHQQSPLTYNYHNTDNSGCDHAPHVHVAHPVTQHPAPRLNIPNSPDIPDLIDMGSDAYEDNLLVDIADCSPPATAAVDPFIIPFSEDTRKIKHYKISSFFRSIFTTIIFSTLAAVYCLLESL